MVRIKAECRGGGSSPPLIKTVSGAKTHSLDDVCLAYIFCLMDQMKLG